MPENNRLEALRAGREPISQGEEKKAYDLGDRLLLTARPFHPVQEYVCLGLTISRMLFPKNFPEVFEYTAGNHPNGFIVVEKIPTTPEYEACVRSTYSRGAYGKPFDVNTDSPLSERHRLWVETGAVQRTIEEVASAGINAASNPANIIKNAKTGEPVFIEFVSDPTFGEQPPLVRAVIGKHILKNTKEKQLDELIRLLNQYGTSMDRDYRPPTSEDLSVAID